MDFPALYAEAEAEISKGARALRRWTPAQTRELILALNSTHPHFREALRLVGLSHIEREFAPAIEALLIVQTPEEQLVDALHACQRHVVQARLKEGLRLSAEFLERLQQLLRHGSPLVVEWVLRTIDEAGAQGVFFRPQLAQVRPSVFSLWRAQSRTILELVTMLERKWAPRAVQKPR